MGNRHRGRELAFQILYQMEQGGHEDIAKVAMDFLPGQKANPQARDFARDIARGAWKELPALDAALAASATNWDLKRFAAVDRAILRMGAYELLFRTDIPYEVTIDECIEIAKAYGGDESPRFINGVLDQLRKANPRPKQEAMRLPREKDPAAGGGPEDGEEEEDR